MQVEFFLIEVIIVELNKNRYGVFNAHRNRIIYNCQKCNRRYYSRDEFITHNNRLHQLMKAY